MAQQRTMTVREAAAHLNVSLTTVYEKFDQGELPGYRVGRKILVYKTGVERLEKLGRNTPPEVSLPGGRAFLIQPPPGLIPG